MNGLDRLFPTNGSLPCPFVLRLNGTAKQVGHGEPAFELQVRNESGAKALRSLNELAIAEAYVRGDLEIEGDVIRAMWFRNLLSDDNLWIKTWRRLQPLLLGRLKLNPAWIAKHYDLDSNPGMGDSGLYYYYHTFAKALNALGQDEFKDDKGESHNWRHELIAALAERQQKDGSWVNSNARWLEGDANLVTGYALLALSYCKPK